MKKFLCIAAAILTALSIAACDDDFIVITGDNATESTAISGTAASSVAATDEESIVTSASDDTHTAHTAQTQEKPSETGEWYNAGLAVIKFTSPVKPNSNATLTLRGSPNTEYAIFVVYSTGASTAKGLEAKISDGDGIVSWTWKIGGKVKSGSYRVTVKGGGTVADFTLEVK